VLCCSNWVLLCCCNGQRLYTWMSHVAVCVAVCVAECVAVCVAVC